ncbi:hypothetical protein V1477_013017 [Vespula maculifrons]|uniref:Uncharacterized protein n=1 Tax=Vespula maculifrons TaxID=7453 RepID=A0ABD2BUQ2_VESMC
MAVVVVGCAPMARMLMIQRLNSLFSRTIRCESRTKYRRSRYGTVDLSRPRVTNDYRYSIISCINVDLKRLLLVGWLDAWLVGWLVGLDDGVTSSQTGEAIFGESGEQIEGGQERWRGRVSRDEFGLSSCFVSLFKFKR